MGKASSKKSTETKKVVKKVTEKAVVVAKKESTKANAEKVVKAVKVEVSALQVARSAYAPKLPPALKNGALVDVKMGKPTQSVADQAKIKKLCPNTYGLPVAEFVKAKKEIKSKAINVGVILSGGQAPGGHNVIAGLFDGLMSINKKSKLFGFLGGPSGLMDGKYLDITDKVVAQYRNTGGFDMIGSGRTKLESVAHFEAAKATCKAHGITALVIIGGDDSNTNACLLAEYFLKTKADIQVIGCPKTIDGDLKNQWIETSFGFDTACRVYSELIGNIQRDANSAKKYWHFIKLMGRSASHIGLECALQTQPNFCVISEEVESKQWTLGQIVDQIATVIASRAANGENFGTVLIPEGLIEFIPEFKVLIHDLNEMLAKETKTFEGLKTEAEKITFVTAHLGKNIGKLYATLPTNIQLQLIKDRDPHGNVQVSLIETEKLMAEMVSEKLSSMKAKKLYVGKFASQVHFMGYEGRCAAPSNFDADYCYGLGYTASALIANGLTGYLSSVRNLTQPQAKWVCGGIPITMMMNMERRHGEDKAVIKKALVELDGAPFKAYAAIRDTWAINTSYVYPGPIQYWGPSAVCDQVTKTIALERKKK